MPQYWLVGAYRLGTEPHDEEFVARGFWKLFHSDEDEPGYAALRDQIKPGDRIAIKRMRGRGNRGIVITTLGIVTGRVGKRVKVNWVARKLDRVVASKGCFGSIHGPFASKGKDAKWIRDVFLL